MELIEDFKDVNNQYSKKIRIINYTEGEKVLMIEKGVEDICEIIIGNNELEYNNIDKNHRKSYIVNKKLEIAEKFVKNEDYSKKFTVKLIQSGLQSINYLSSILYLNEHYNINCIIYNDETKKFYHTSFKDKPKIIIVYKNNSWFLEKNDLVIDNLHDDISEISNILTIDCDIMIYKPYLKPISNYKLKELEDSCKERDISILNEKGKKKLKKELYDEINLYEIKK